MKKLRIILIIAILAALLLSILPATSVLAATYTVKTGTHTESTAPNGARSVARESDGTLWCAYARTDGSKYQIYAAYSTDGGEEWTEEQLTNETSINAHQDMPSIAIDSNDYIHVAWYGKGWGTDTSKYSIQYRMRTTSWQAQEALTNIASNQEELCMAIDSNDYVHVVWEGVGWGTNTIYYNLQYRMRTTSWQTQEAITDHAEHQVFASIAIDSSDNVHVVWEGKGWGSYPDLHSVQYRKRTTSWQTQEAVADQNYQQMKACIAIDSSDNVHVVWNGVVGSYPTKYNIQYRMRTTSWQTQEAITNVDAHQYKPSIAIDTSDNIHVVWQGLGWGTYTAKYNIQYRKRTTSWQAQAGITDRNYDQGYAILLWALHPTVATLKPNCAETGYAFVWSGLIAAGFQVDYFRSNDLRWDGEIFPPAVTTQAASSIADTTARLNGAITDTGGDNPSVTVYWGETNEGQVAGSWDSNSIPTSPAQPQGVASFYKDVTGLVPNTLYYFTARAINTAGTSWAAVLSFTTHDIPTMTTDAASSVATTTARLNGTVVDDGDGDVTVRFGWGLTSEATIEAYDDYEAVAGTFNTGEHPYLDVGSLLDDTLYYFRVEGTNDEGTDLGAELSFTTEAELADVTNFKAIPLTTTVSLTWASAVGASQYKIRYKIGSYPVDETDGIHVYFGTSTSTTHEGLTPGSTYYYGAWSESGGNYSDNGAFVLATTAAVVEGGEHLEPPIEPSRWIAAPDYTNLSGLLFFYDAVNNSADALGMPRASFWMMLALGLSVGIGLLTYLVSKGKLLIAFIALSVSLFFGWVILIIPFWIPLLSIILIVAYFIAHREVAY